MLAIIMIIGAVLLRLVPHIPNFAPITALGLFGGKFITKRFAILVPLTAMILSDYLLLYISPFEMKADFSRIYPIQALFHSTTLYVWGSFVISGLIGIAMRKTNNPAIIFGATCVASLQFFFVTNFGVWAAGAYDRGIDGLMQSYLMGLPFFKWTLIGDLFYTSVFFTSFVMAQKIAKQPSVRQQELLQN